MLMKTDVVAVVVDDVTSGGGWRARYWITIYFIFLCALLSSLEATLSVLQQQPHVKYISTIIKLD